MPLAEEAKHLAEEIYKEKQAEQWAGIPREKLLNQSFLDQLNSLQILEQLVPLQLAKEHLPSDIIDILERLEKQIIYLSTNFTILLKIVQTGIILKSYKHSYP